MKEKVRLDKLLVLKNHVENVSKAKALIMSGKVIVNEIKIEKPGTKFTTNINIRIIKKPYNWVSRGGVKLDYAIKQLSLKLENKICADIGSSTGGFTDVLLSRNVAHVYSIDVGKGLLDWKILQNRKVTMLDKTNSRKIILEDINPEISFVQQIIRAFGRVETSLQYLVRSWPIIVELISVWKRLREFEAKLEINRSIEIAK